MKDITADYIKTLSDKDLKELINCGLFDDLKLPELLDKIKKEIELRKEVTNKLKL